MQANCELQNRGCTIHQDCSHAAESAHSSNPSSYCNATAELAVITLITKNHAFLSFCLFAILIRNGRQILLLVNAAIAWHHSSDPQQKAFSLSLLAYRSKQQVLQWKEDYANVDHRRTRTSPNAELWHKPHHHIRHIQILPDGAITTIVTTNEIFTFPRNFPRR